MSPICIYKDKAGEWRWRLRSGNNRIIAASSEGYQSVESCKKNIRQVCLEIFNATMVLSEEGLNFDAVVNEAEPTDEPQSDGGTDDGPDKDDNKDKGDES